MTREQFNAILAKPAIARRNPDAGDTGLCTTEPKQVKGNALERPVSRKDKGGTGPVVRFEICFRVYAVQPCDWDGYHIKEIQDMLVHAQLLPDDNWRILQGRVISEKAHSREEERTEVTIQQLEAING